jgi:hypothetical protein
VIADLSRIVDDSTARLDRMSQQIAEMFPRMGAITRRFLAAVNYRINPALPLFPRYPTSASTSRSHAAPSSSSRPPFQIAFYLAPPPAYPPFRMSPLGGPPLRGPAPTRAPAPAPVPSSPHASPFHPGINHYSIILDCIN